MTLSFKDFCEAQLLALREQLQDEMENHLQQGYSLHSSEVVELSLVLDDVVRELMKRRAEKTTQVFTRHDRVRQKGS